MKIGTARPGAAVLDSIPHHLVGVVDPSYQFTVGEFIKRADLLVYDILMRRNIPVVAGGTAFYIKTFLYGLSNTPPGSENIRNKIKTQLKEKGIGFLQKQLLEIDPASGQRIAGKDINRIVRAIEVFQLSGKPISSYHVSDSLRTQYQFLIIGLNRDRTELYSRIERRVESMFSQGLTEEVKRLMTMGYRSEDPGMKGIGYREFFEMQRGCCSMGDVVNLIKRNSKRFAKRQLTFFRSIPGVNWIHPDERKTIKSMITCFLSEI